jgi:hypothetical protein
VHDVFGALFAVEHDGAVPRQNPETNQVDVGGVEPITGRVRDLPDLHVVDGSSVRQNAAGKRGKDLGLPLPSGPT